MGKKNQENPTQKCENTPIKTNKKTGKRNERAKSNKKEIE